MSVQAVTAMQLMFLFLWDILGLLTIESENIRCLKMSGTNYPVKAPDHKVKVKVKCTLVQALRLCTGHTAHRGSRGIALLFHDHSTKRE